MHTNIHIIGVPEGEEREKGAENIFGDIIAENFPNLSSKGKATIYYKGTGIRLSHDFSVETLQARKE